jgi:16S rRNA (cytidine1402-2'-O)-methyltransferase
MPGTLFVVATPIGNLDDLTGRALRTLRSVAVIAAEDTRRTARLLSHYGIPTPTTSLHAHNEERKSASLVARLARGDDIALVSDAGTPGISDPGRHLVRAALEASIPVSPVPGPSAVMAALSVSGCVADTFLFLGFPPTRSLDRKRWLESLRTAGRTVVFFEAPHRIRATLEAIKAEVGDVPIFLGREITKLHETLVIQPISAAIAGLQRPLGEFVGVIEIGHLTETVRAAAPPAAEMAAEFGHMTESASTTRRQAVARMARKYGLTTNEVYRTIEEFNKSLK